jgi:hypothetical protein
LIALAVLAGAVMFGLVGVQESIPVLIAIVLTLIIGVFVIGATLGFCIT